MRIELILMLITGCIMANIYTDGKYMKLVLSWKKYYQMAGVAFGALMLYWLIKKNPLQARKIITASNEYVKYLPVDKNAANMISPILDFTTRQTMSSNSYGSSNFPILPMAQTHAEHKLMTSGLRSELSEHSDRSRLQPGSQSVKTATKRSVSETKKKFVASSQNWKCGGCNIQLPAWFEVDHKVRLEYGGSNHIDNLIALCRDCHGKKTTIENL